MRRHHFCYGGNRLNYDTTNLEHFNSKGHHAESLEQRRGRGNRFMKEHFDIGVVKKTNFQSNYGSAFQPPDSNIFASLKNRGNLKDKVRELRQTHLVLGGDPLNHVTTQKDHYLNHVKDNATQQAGLKKLNLKSLHETNFDPGHFKNQHESVNRVYFQNQSVDNTYMEEFKENMAAQTKGHHFNWGGQSNDFSTEKNDKHRAYFNTAPMKKVVAKDTLCLHDKKATLVKTSEYNKNYLPKENLSEDQSAKVRDRSSDVNANWSFAHAGGTYLTEKDSKYIAFKNQDIVLRKNMIDNAKIVERLKSTDIASFENDNEKRFITEAHGKFTTDKDDIQKCRGVLNQAQIERQRGHQHKLGDTDEPTKESEYGKRYTKNAREPIEKPERIRLPPCFKIGHDSRREFRTTNRQQYNFQAEDIT